MAGIKKIKLQRIKALMLFSQVLLLVFTVQWLTSQFDDQQEQLKKNLTKLFTDVQQKINDSLYLSNVVDTIQLRNMAYLTPVVISQGNKMKKLSLSPQGIHKVLTGVPITASEQKKLFMLDTIAFNEMFASQMKLNGWNFQSEWINNPDSNKKGRAIFIRSSFFTDENGVVVKNYKGYLFVKILPQLFFVMVLLCLTTAAFLITFKSLKAQIKLGAMKDDFINNMSHELKTPIATVKVALEALNNFNIIDNPRLGREYLGIAASEMDRLELLATRVLNTSLLESGKIHMLRESFNLKQLVDEVVQSMQLRLQQFGGRVQFEFTGTNFLVPVDKLHMQGVLINLIDNSLKYGQSPVNIHIRLSENQGAVQLALSDNGPGIPEEYKEKIFEKFFRVPNENRHNTRGYGLGLSYAAQVMRQHNGSINVNNIAGGGCVFTLTF